jgi:hypothetical protein
VSEIWRCWEAERLLERPARAVFGWVLVAVQLLATIGLIAAYH